jgi:hypothetical protein
LKLVFSYIFHEDEIMNMKQHLSIAGLFLVIFVPAAFAGLEQLREQQQHEQIQSRELMPFNQGLEEQRRDQTRSRTMSEEQERMHQQQQMQDRTQQRGMMPQRGKGGGGGGRGGR